MDRVTRAINRAKREAAKRPVTVTVQVRRDLWTKHRAQIVEELGKLGTVWVAPTDLKGIGEEMARRGCTLTIELPHGERTG